MPNVHPFTPYCFSPSAGRMEDLIVTSRGRISPDVRDHHLARNPNSVAGMFSSAGPGCQIKAAGKSISPSAQLEQLIAQRFLEQVQIPALFACYQEFSLPDCEETFTSKSFIALGEVDPYECGSVFRHERTLPQRRIDQIAFLREAQAHFDPIQMIYSDPGFHAERTLDRIFLRNSPILQVVDDDQVKHKLFEVNDLSVVQQLCDVIANKKVLIADGHHRYEAALALNRCDHSQPYQLMMAFTNVHEGGLKMLPTHRLVAVTEGLSLKAIVDRAKAFFSVQHLPSMADLKTIWMTPDEAVVRIAMLISGSRDVLLLTRARKDHSDVTILHDEVLPGLFENARRPDEQERIISYVRSATKAQELIAGGGAQAAFLLEPTKVEQVFDFAMQNVGTMPPKSTDFFPKIPSGLLIQRANRANPIRACSSPCIFCSSPSSSCA